MTAIKKILRPLLRNTLHVKAGKVEGKIFLRFSAELTRDNLEKCVQVSDYVLQFRKI